MTRRIKKPRPKDTAEHQTDNATKNSKNAIRVLFSAICSIPQLLFFVEHVKLVLSFCQKLLGKMQTDNFGSGRQKTKSTKHQETAHETFKKKYWDHLPSRNVDAKTSRSTNGNMKFNTNDLNSTTSQCSEWEGTKGNRIEGRTTVQSISSESEHEPDKIPRRNNETQKRNTTKESDGVSSVLARSLTGKEEEQEEEEEEEIHVYSNRDLLQRRDVNINGKTIVFRAMNGFDGFSDRIKINIPPFSVLGNETICLEIIPEYIVNNYNRMRTNRIIITPILHVDRKNSAPFLRTVTITLPLTSDSNKWLAPGIKSCPPTMEYSKKMLSVTIKTKTFSPVAGVYEPIKEVLDAMGLDDESAITYEMRGIYLIIDQLTTFSEFDLRKFKDWREHRKFRMDETKFFWMLFNPPEMKECYYRKEIKVTIGGEFEIQNTSSSSHIDGNVIKFSLPNPRNNVDRRNKRRVRIRKLKSEDHFTVRIWYEPQEMRQFADECNESIRLLTSQDIEYINTLTNLAGNQEILIQSLQIFDGKWFEFLEQHLEIDICGLQQFILDDIKYTIAESYNNMLEGTNVKLIQSICNMKGYVDYKISGDSIESLVDSVFNNFRTGMQMKTAKVKILQMLMDGGIISKGPINNGGLHPNYLETLSSALMYLPVQKLRNGIKGMYKGKSLLYTDDIKKFIQTSKEQDMEMD